MKEPGMDEQRMGKEASVVGRLAAVAMMIVVPAGVEAQQSDVGVDSAPVADRCSDEAFREFDFWRGTWEVRSPEGERLGLNRIRPAAGGCALVEEWRGEAGGEGVSINTYDPGLDAWTQRWVGAGSTLWLVGGLDESGASARMVLKSPEPRVTPEGPVLDRISWEPVDGDRVIQVWEVSRDGGESWEEIFRGVYVSVGGGAAGGGP